MRPVLYVVGTLLAILAVGMLVPAAVDLASGHDDWQVFAQSAGLTLFFGVALRLMNSVESLVLNVRQAFLLTGLCWVAISLFAALPFFFATDGLDLVDSIFEAVSGLTTTGSTVMIGLDTMPPGILLWRSILQWLGGIGIIALGIAVLPFLRVGGMQLFRSESSDRSDKVVPRAADLATALGGIYLTLTLICWISLAAAGMTAFEALNHAFTAVATGGFSTRDASIAGWASPAVEWVLIVFMILGALPFVRYVTLLRGDPQPLWRDSQIRWFLRFLVTMIVVVAAWLLLTTDMTVRDAVRGAAFNVVSVITTTGYASADYTSWGAFSIVLFFLLIFIGGCTGSTSGGVKVFRFEIAFLALRTQLRRLYSPNQVVPLTYQGRPVEAEVMISVMSFGFVFIALTLILAAVLGLLGLDFITALSGSATAFANVGPGLDPQIGPVGNFAGLPDVAKLLLAAAMILGRLEFFTILVLLSPQFWRT